MPTLIGWAAASDSISSGKAWMLYALLFLWQLPSFHGDRMDIPR